MNFNWSALEENFQSAVQEYRKAVIDNYYCRQSDSVDTETPKAKVLKIYQKCPFEKKLPLLYIGLKVFLAPLHGDDDRLVSLLHQKSRNLNVELEAA